MYLTPGRYSNLKPGHTPAGRDRTTLATLVLSSVVASSTALAQDADSMASPEPGTYTLAASGTLFDPVVPEVLTTARLRQPKSRVPGTTTIIEGEMIRDLGIQNLVEVFRLVPGMTVAAVGSNRPVTSYHGTVAYEQRRMQVQVDGRTAYQPNLAHMDWNAMPVPLELIERIEVSRGPNAAAYGVNAFLGTINIITRSPEDTDGVSVSTSVGSRGHRNLLATVGDASGDYFWRLAYQKRKSDGFDQQIREDGPAPFHNGFDMNTLLYDAVANLDGPRSVDLRAGVVDGVDEQDRFKAGTAEFGGTGDPDVKVDDYYLQTRFNHALSDNHFYHLQVSFQNYRRAKRWPIELSAGELAAIGLPVPAGAPPLRGELNEDLEESRLELELQDTLYFSPDLRLVSGLGYREDIYQSETFFNGRGKHYQSRAFGNLEYSATDWVTFNAGGNWEKTTTTGDDYFSPRVAANFILAANHTLRFVFSRAVRTPDAFEQDPDWGYRVRNVRPDIYADFADFRLVPRDQAFANTPTLGKDLQEERIISREISYFGQYDLAGGLLSTEVRYFYDHLRDVVSGVITADEWTIDNNVALDQQGVELEAMLEFPGTTLRMNYGYMDQDGRYTGTEPASAEERRRFLELTSRMTVRHSGSVAVIQQLANNFSVAGAYYIADEFQRTGSFQRLDLRIARRVYMASMDYELAFTMQHYLNDNPLYSEDNVIEDRNQFYLEAAVRF